MTKLRKDGRRPLTARSVVASTLLGVDPPSLPTSSLVRTASLFGVQEGTVRVAMSRMVAKCELEADGDGYRLAGPLVARQERQDLSRRGATGPWDGTWELAIVGDGRRAASDRAALRHALEDLRLAEWREGVWLRPANLPADRSAGSRAVRDAQCAVLVGARPDVDAGLEVSVDQLWDLAWWSRHARDLRDEMADLRPALDRRDADVLAPAFECAAAVLRHFQADPLLPSMLAPPAWPGDALRRDYEPFVAAFQHTLRSWMRRIG